MKDDKKVVMDVAQFAVDVDDGIMEDERWIAGSEDRKRGAYPRGMPNACCEQTFGLPKAGLVRTSRPEYNPFPGLLNCRVLYSVF